MAAGFPSRSVTNVPLWLPQPKFTDKFARFSFVLVFEGNPDLALRTRTLGSDRASSPIRGKEARYEFWIWILCMLTVTADGDDIALPLCASPRVENGRLVAATPHRALRNPPSSSKLILSIGVQNIHQNQAARHRRRTLGHLAPLLGFLYYTIKFLILDTISVQAQLSR
jgi:hypothetical protein